MSTKGCLVIAQKSQVYQVIKYLYICQNFSVMESNVSTTKSWIYFIIWFAIMIVLLVYYRQFFWLALPGVITYFAKGLRLF